MQEELETLLNESGNLRTLAFLYASKGMSSKALAIWRILARNYSSGHWRDVTGQTDSQQATTNLISGKDIAAIEASKILEKSSDQDLILQHLGWVCIKLFCLVFSMLDKRRCCDILNVVAFKMFVSHVRLQI